MMKLKPCPFCGGGLEVDEFGIWNHPSNDCLLATAYDGEIPLLVFGSREIERWNRRVGDDLMERMEDDGK